jgi:hypothetical protein
MEKSLQVVEQKEVLFYDDGAPRSTQTECPKRTRERVTLYG